MSVWRSSVMASGHRHLLCQRVLTASFAVTAGEHFIARFQEQNFAGETCLPKRTDLGWKGDREISIANVDAEGDAPNVLGMRTQLSKGGK